MDKHGLTHKQMGERCGVDQSTITRACRGQFSTDLAKKIFKETGEQVTANDLLGMVPAGEARTP